MCSKKMYKTQFNKWSWRKYRNSEAVSGDGRSCVRRPDKRVKVLHNESLASNCVEEAIWNLHNFIQSDSTYFTRVSKFDPLYSYDELTLNARSKVLINGGLSYMHRGNHDIGGVYLRAGFLQLEEDLVTTNLHQSFDIIVRCVVRFITTRSEEILERFLTHIINVSHYRSLRNSPLARIAGCLRTLVRLPKGQAHVRQYLSASYELRSDQWILRN